MSRQNLASKKVWPVFNNAEKSRRGLAKPTLASKKREHSIKAIPSLPGLVHLNLRVPFGRPRGDYLIDYLHNTNRKYLAKI
jgi:hypothetical protein